MLSIAAKKNQQLHWFGYIRKYYERNEKLILFYIIRVEGDGFSYYVQLSLFLQFNEFQRRVHEFPTLYK